MWDQASRPYPAPVLRRVEVQPSDFLGLEHVQHLAQVSEGSMPKISECR